MDPGAWRHRKNATLFSNLETEYKGMGDKAVVWGMVKYAVLFRIWKILQKQREK